MIHNRRFFLAAVTATAMLVLSGLSVYAAQKPTDVVSTFYSSLITAMQSNKNAAGRFEILKPTISEVFDIPTMTKIVIGPTWTGLPSAKKDEAIEAFREYIVMSYASRFKRFTNQRFDVIEARDANNKRMLVLSKLVRPGEEDIQFNYLLWLTKNNWQVIDIYLGGTISEMARLRSEFSEVIQREGIDSLLSHLKAKSVELAKGE